MINGILAIRNWDEKEGQFTVSWGFGKASAQESPKMNGRLYSTGVNGFWTSSDMKADQRPELYNENGLYAYPLKLSSIHSKICGIVELTGKIIFHSDGIMRAEQARILYLFINKSIVNQQALNLMYQIYQVPMTVTNSLRDSVKNWMVKEGKPLIRRNAELIKFYDTKALKTPEVTYETYEVKEPETKPEDLASIYGTLTFPYIDSMSTLEIADTETSTNNSGFLKRALKALKGGS